MRIAIWILSILFFAGIVAVLYFRVYPRTSFKTTNSTADIGGPGFLHEGPFPASTNTVVQDAYRNATGGINYYTRPLDLGYTQGPGTIQYSGSQGGLPYTSGPGQLQTQPSLGGFAYKGPAGLPGAKSDKGVFITPYTGYTSDIYSYPTYGNYCYASCL